MKKILIIPVFLFVNSLFAQLPDVDIYLTSLIKMKDGNYQLGDHSNIINRKGYDNQPAFSPDGRFIYFSSIRDNVQSDIYVYNLLDQSHQQITNTIESEYSPVFTRDGKSFTVVRVEKDSIQRMWLFNKDGSNAKVILERIDSIGYYCRIDKKRFVLWFITEPPTLALTDTKSQELTSIDKNIGRCIKNIPGEKAFSYLVKDSESEWTIKRYDLKNKTSGIICKIPSTSEDYIWTNEKKIIMGRQNQFWMYNYKTTNDWKMIGEISSLKGKNIYRLALAPDGINLAFVADE